MVEEALLDAAIRVDTAVAEEGPVAAHLFDARQIDLADQDLLLVGRRFDDDDAEGIAEEGSAPELEARVALVADAVHRRDVDAVGDGVPALDRAPRVALGDAVLRFLVRVPADGRRVEDHRRALQRREPRVLGIPLVPADERADAARLGIEGAEPEVARREVILLVERRVVGDVHLAVEPDLVAFEDRRAVVVEAPRALLEDGRHHRYAGLPRLRRQPLRRRARHRLGQVEERRVLALAEIVRAEQLGKAHHLRSLARGFLDARGGLLEVRGGIGRHGHLHQGHAEVVRRHGPRFNSKTTPTAAGSRAGCAAPSDPDLVSVSARRRAHRYASSVPRRSPRSRRLPPAHWRNCGSTTRPGRGMRLSPGYGAVDSVMLGTERQFPQDGAASVLSGRARFFGAVAAFDAKPSRGVAHSRQPSVSASLCLALVTG